jgi:hypothetical protein
MLGTGTIPLLFEALELPVAAQSLVLYDIEYLEGTGCARPLRVKCGELWSLHTVAVGVFAHVLGLTGP